jgi:hypothetical protein
MPESLRDYERDSCTVRLINSGPRPAEDLLASIRQHESDRHHQVTVQGTVPMGDEDQWMTYEALAQARRTSKRAAIMLVRRHKWRREKNNEGHTIALVPVTWAAPLEADSGGGHSAANSTTHAIVVLEQALSALREAHARELAVLHEAHDAVTTALRAEVEQAQSRAQDALQALEELRQSRAKRAGQGRWARLRLAWRG